MSSDGQSDTRVSLSSIESRLITLEVKHDHAYPRVDKLEPKLESLLERVARLEERVAHLPSKGMIFTIAATMIAALTGLVAFAGKIQSLVGVGPHG
jgi:hypothetical protein